MSSEKDLYVDELERIPEGEHGRFLRFTARGYSPKTVGAAIDYQMQRPIVSQPMVADDWDVSVTGLRQVWQEMYGSEVGDRNE